MSYNEPPPNQPPPPMPPGGYQDYKPVPQKSNKPLISLICGIVGLVCCFLVSIAAIVLGYQAKQDIERSGSTEGKGMAQAGFILGIVGLVINVVVNIIYLKARG